MSKIIFLGTDLHGSPTELASKTVIQLKSLIKDYKIVSIEHRKSLRSQKNTWILSRLVKNSRIRRIFQGLILPLYLAFARICGYNKILFFWVANSKYHRFLFKFLKLIGFNLVFTIISGEDTNIPVLKACDLIVCQSPRMQMHVQRVISKSKVRLIRPAVDTHLFKPSSKKSGIIIPSVPYSLGDFKDRGIDKILSFLEKTSLPATMIFRSKEAYDYVKSQKIKNLKLINKDLSDKELSEIMAKSKIMPLVYTKSPDMPLSAIEGMASGCAIICTEHMGLVDIIKDEKAGIVLKSEKGLFKALSKISNNPRYNKNARKAAEKYFDIKNLNKYLELIRK